MPTTNVTWRCGHSPAPRWESTPYGEPQRPIPKVRMTTCPPLIEDGALLIDYSFTKVHGSVQETGPQASYANKQLKVRSNDGKEPKGRVCHGGWYFAQGNAHQGLSWSYVCGEPINVDGVTGGCNFMNYWEGHVAGTSAAATPALNVEQQTHRNEPLIYRIQLFNSVYNTNLCIFSDYLHTSRPCGRKPFRFFCCDSLTKVCFWSLLSCLVCPFSPSQPVALIARGENTPLILSLPVGQIVCSIVEARQTPCFRVKELPNIRRTKFLCKLFN
jgi:hypothetical protein